MNKNKAIAFIGAGNMARAMIAGLIQNHFPADHIWASSPNIATHPHYKNDFHIHTTDNNIEAAKQADIIVFAVKPWLMETVCQEIKNVLHEKQPLLISFVTGITTPTISRYLENKHSAIVRTMPNIASSVGAGATGLFANDFTTPDQKIFSESLFRSIGTTVWVENENQLDVITAVSGSGPAYLFYIFEAMQKAAESMGLSSEQAKLLIAQTATGAAKMSMETDQSFEQLRRLVTAEKGTTAAATAVLNQHDVTSIIKMAMEAAFNRAKELAT
ncbi:MAG: pyrroline-5-carboxylate reductase [Gammaproteobacteria bacterium CG_4_10_14_0_8_um_filter_38_16]|nr:MAG: pyrroline-5-carboxylate reductase [Gammaproteobacteria bacterium CG_4_10_14_0_8_um_filter_38_16]PJA03225.1 MAG: pyrroline-5-carboxylate reductase [Gammaproteobacteria bacterium CG_4_10_14_0_2_um_filter_38_22]PJB10903.1 MAG: pyrroline-5-carboxylate reductase [Gammaproteobacteria bacterium CG_4_9_14_3_um_filter_38_9]